MSTTYRSETSPFVVTRFSAGTGQGQRIEIVGVQGSSWVMRVEEARELTRLLTLAIDESKGCAECGAARPGYVPDTADDDTVHLELIYHCGCDGQGRRVTWVEV